jgi:class 3 adenylate cyclase
MFNQMSDPIRRKAINAMERYNIPVFSESFEPMTSNFFKLAQTLASINGIVGVLFYPVYESSQSNNIAGSLAIDFSWKLLFEIGLTEQSDGIVTVLENTCGQVYTFKVVENQIEFVGEGDFHDTAFDSLEVSSTTDQFLNLVSSISPRRGFQTLASNWGCAYIVRVYPSTSMRSRYLNNKPRAETFIVVSVFVFTSSVFLLYDFIVRRLQAKVMSSAKRSEKIVSSLFPAVVRDRLFNDRSRASDVQSSTHSSDNESSQKKNRSAVHGLLNHKVRLKSYLNHPPSVDICHEPEPIADLFPNTTILFADIAGFTAWSSEREPPQVFKLLETLYSAFDEVARKLGVFKVETIGDCYVAVTGLPEPEKDHAVVMVKFASQCILRMHELTRKLESSLGPGTAELALRVGLHSGSVTAGVLRGERARFQLFGDTVNVASRMESTGKVNQIHVSAETANLLFEAGKSDWVEERNEVVTVKGKGQMQTFWVNPNVDFRRKGLGSDMPSHPKQGVFAQCDTVNAMSFAESNNQPSVWGETNLDAALAVRASTSSRRDRLVEWNTDILHQLLQKVVAKRNAIIARRNRWRPHRISQTSKSRERTTLQAVDEITEAIEMPIFDERVAMSHTVVDIGPAVQSQLQNYVARIASLYQDNAFHNFEHASHVAMSASKLLKRIISPDDVDYRTDEESGEQVKSKQLVSKDIHVATFGISSDPLMQFAAVFAALIHDVDHRGVTNQQLVDSNDPLAIIYSGKCVAEQHSVQCAWGILMEDQYEDLRLCIYQTDEDQSRFRQLVVNALIATDIADKELQTWRQNRWNKVFHKEVQSNDEAAMIDRKATIVFEYIIQASDVAHTMQHWHVYQKWNQRLFEERYVAFIDGKDGEDPSINWYQGELSFFDNYVIPLARNLKECNVFGVSCDEFLTYALGNRHEWAVKGKQITSEMVPSFDRQTLLVEVIETKFLKSISGLTDPVVVP